MSDADALIASLEQLLAKKRQLKQGAMQELLTGRGAYRDFEMNTVCKQTEMGLVPADWDSVSIDDVVRYNRKRYHLNRRQYNYRENGRPFVRSQNLGWGALLLDDLVYIDDDTHRTFLAPSFVVAMFFLILQVRPLGGAQWLTNVWRAETSISTSASF